MACRVGHCGPGVMIAMGRARPHSAGRWPWRFTPDLFDEGLRQRVVRAIDDRCRPSELGQVPPRLRCGRVPALIAGAILLDDRCGLSGDFSRAAGWYARRFRPAAAAARRAPDVARLAPPITLARVFLNGRFIRSASAADRRRSCVELTGHAPTTAATELLIQVDNRRRRRSGADAPFRLVRMMVACYRSVDLLVALPALLHHRRVHSAAPPDQRPDGQIVIQMRLSDPIDGVCPGSRSPNSGARL